MTGPSGIYCITCMANGKIYVGSAVNFGARWSMHRHLLRQGKHHSRHLQRAWNKHGGDGFAFSVLEEVSDPASLIEREQFYIDLLKPFGETGYNISPRAGHTLGAKRTPEQVEKTASKNRGRKRSAEHRAAISARTKGRKHTEESKAKIRAAKLLNNPQRGKPLTEAQKAALFKSGPDHPWFGKHHSEASKNKASLAKSSPVVQIKPDGTEVFWRTALQARSAIGLRSADTIYRAINGGRVAAGYRWKWATPVSA